MSTITGAPYAGATLTVDLGAIRANYRLLRSRLGATACAAVVKADAYGLGAAAVAPALAPVLNSLAQVDAWAALGRRLGRAVPAALQVDSGMSRLGLGEAKLAASPERLHGIQLRLVMSHLACAERQDPC